MRTQWNEIRSASTNTGRGALRRLMGGACASVVTALALACMLAGEAQAQSTNGINQFWDGQLTASLISETLSGSDTIEEIGFLGTTGALSRRDSATYDGTTYEITGLFKRVRFRTATLDVLEEELEIRFASGKVPTGIASDLFLEFERGDDTNHRILAFSDGTYNPSARAWVWDNPGVNFVAGRNYSPELGVRTPPPRFNRLDRWWADLGENPAPGERVGGSWAATDYTMRQVNTYTLEGRDAALFTINVTGQIHTVAGETYDYETQQGCSVKPGVRRKYLSRCFELTVMAKDQYDGTARMGVAIGLNNEIEKRIRELRAVAPAGTAGAFEVSFLAPGAGETPKYYRIQYQLTDGTGTQTQNPKASEMRIHNRRSSYTVLGVAANTEYRVRVRPIYEDDEGPYWGEGTSWSSWATVTTGREGPLLSSKPTASLAIASEHTVVRRSGNSLVARMPRGSITFRFVLSDIVNSHRLNELVYGTTYICWNERWGNGYGTPTFTPQVECMATNNTEGTLGVVLGNPRLRNFVATSGSSGYVERSRYEAGITNMYIASPYYVTLGPGSRYNLGTVRELCVEFANERGIVRHPCTVAPLDGPKPVSGFVATDGR